jgi:hypothetical protein
VDINSKEKIWTLATKDNSKDKNFYSSFTPFPPSTS